jgi:hypothetical protein
MRETEQTDVVAGAKRSRASLLLLLIPVFALIFPGVYNRETPTIFGFPFFYWYQLAWVVFATIVLGIVYKLRKTPNDR